jgi:F-type H+-transporting ATPase subunit a
MSANPLDQFKIIKLIPITVAGYDVSFTNSSLWMVIVSATLCAIGYGVTRQSSLVPSRMQCAFEYVYTFIADLLKSNLGREGRTFFPYIFPLFLFILTSNLMGLLPYSFTVTSHFAVTFTLALTVFLAATIIGIIKHKSHFLRTFLPHGTPLFIAPILVPIEIISYLARPISLSVRLFANMVAGHVMIKIFAGFVTMLIQKVFFVAILGIIPIALNTVLTGFEIVICCLQAYIFTVLTCIYVNDALSLH